MHTLPNMPLGPRVTLDITVFSPWEATKNGLTSWSLAPLQRAKDTSENPFLTDALARVFAKLRIRNAYAPKVTSSSARIVTTDLLDATLHIGDCCLHRNKNLPADGVLIPKRKAFVMSSAGCPIILASAVDHFIVAHASRDSLIDRDAVMGNPSRPKHLSSIVYAIIDAFKKKGIPPRKVDMVMLFAINAMDFEHSENHPQYGKYNHKLAEYVEERWPDGIIRENRKTFLDLEGVFMEQACRAGVQYVWTTDSLSEYPLLAHTRDGRNPLRRNLVVVKRN